MQTKKFGFGNYQIMPLNDIGRCADVFQSWIDVATEDLFSNRVFTMIHTMKKLGESNGIDTSEDYDMVRTVGSKLYSFEKTSSIEKEKFVSISITSDDFIVKFKQVPNEDGTQPSMSTYTVQFKNEDKHSVVLVGDNYTDAKPMLRKFIPGPWIEKFYTLDAELKALVEPVAPKVMSKHEEMRAFREEYASFGIMGFKQSP